MKLSPREFIEHCLFTVTNNQSLQRDETRMILEYLLDRTFNEANDVCFGALFGAMQAKGPTVDEVLGLMDAVMLYDRKPIEFEGRSGKLCGIIGSGKDQIKTFNISTAAAVLAAAAGVDVVKNGSRSEMSVSGTTDVLEALGVPVLNNDPRVLKQAFDETHFVFCDAEPYFPKMVKEYLGKFLFAHPLSYILPIASGISFDRVVFGLSTSETEFVASLLSGLGFTKSIVVTGFDKDHKAFDEISVVGKTKISEILGSDINTYEISPEDWGIETQPICAIKSGTTLKENADILKTILSGGDFHGKKYSVIINAAALCYIADIVNSPREGVELCSSILASGRAIEILEKYTELLGGKLLV